MYCKVDLSRVLIRVLSQLTVTEFVDMHNFVMIHHSIANIYAYITFSEYMMLFFNYYFMEE